MKADHNKLLYQMLMMVTLVLFLIILFGCAEVKHQIAFNEQYEPPENIKIQVGEVFNDTGFESDVNIEELLTDALEEELDAEGLLWMGKEGPKLILVSRIVNYQKGSAAKRWVAPGWGSTILAVECDLQEQNGNIVGIVKAKGEVAAGGLYSAGAWMTIFKSVADDIARDLKREFEGKAYVTTTHSERTEDAWREKKEEPLVLTSNKPWAGKWRVEWSDGVSTWNLIQDGSQVRSVQGAILKLKARVKGDRLLGMLESSAGDAITLDLTVSEDGQSFKGEGDSWGKTIIYEAKKIDPTSKPDAVTKKMPETFDPKAPWTGIWKVEGWRNVAGPWALKQTGNTIVSTKKSMYKIEGEAIGYRMKGVLGRNEFSIKMSPDGNSFTGKITNSVTYYIKGNRSGATSQPTVAVNPNEPWTGTWRVSGTMWGDEYLKLKQSGNEVKSISGSDRKLKGKVSGNRLKGWYSGGGQGYATITFKISNDGRSFKGEFFSGSMYFGKLDGKRIE